MEFRVSGLVLGQLPYQDCGPLAEVTDTAWIIFIVSIIALLVLDLGVFNRKAHVIKPREALMQVAFFIGAAVVFNVGIYLSMGSTSGLEFTTGYLMELMLSVDNLFVIILIFGSFCVPAQDQHKVLFYGILGALVFRFAFIFVGVTLVESFGFILYIFGAFLIITGIRMAIGKEKENVEPDHHIMVRLFRKFLPITKGYEGDKFFVRRPGTGAKAGKMVLWATPMFVALLVVESTDIIFAVDSIPAILGITTNAFIVFSSNAFAVLGLRSLYFSLSHVMNLFCYLKYGLAGILTFVGVKMLLPILDPNFHFPVELSLAVIVSILGVAIAASWLKTRRTGVCPVVEEVQADACPALKDIEGSEEK
ncbi:MAG: TerC family protein [Methanomassiliicoccus sp.]|nr:TerC family protein [Methanomassiliicoccus sp.]